jgi:hypothetical protein
VSAGARWPRRKGFEATRPPDVSDARWQAALRGLQAFVASGWGDRAEAAGWTRDELYAVPKLWSRVDLTGVALLIADDEVVEVAPTEITVKTASGAVQIFCRKPEPNWSRVYLEQTRLRRCDTAAGDEEALFRARESTTREYQRFHNTGLDHATRAVDAIIAAKEKTP